MKLLDTGMPSSQTPYWSWELGTACRFTEQPPIPEWEKLLEEHLIRFDSLYRRLKD